ncbi:hypothetical protein P43SY_009061 [Pythium insidiosum]|uniref:tRNA (guanine(9)-N(1))-methyltransferase n=1 Tax=Pythium insidiosum TaxID=114742 RepID=A0AAD5QE54_PYTIN|nr:hypothetical protein P43SY_009061 [Pythium insidiosum]
MTEQERVDRANAKQRALRQRKRQQRQELLHSMNADERRAFLQAEDDEKVAQLQRLEAAAQSDGSDRVTIALDLRYDHIMNEKELSSLSKQLKFVYGSVKTMPEPFQLRLFQCSDALRSALARFSSDRWIVRWHDHEELTDVVAPSDLVYLSPDSPNVLTSLDRSKTYVIGGIVDKSRKKGATLNAAEGAGLTTARLPIQEHITERLDHILNVNTVVDVLIHFHTHGDWRRALTETLPTRKQSAVGRRALRRQQLVGRQSTSGPSGSAAEDQEKEEIIASLVQSAGRLELAGEQP